MSKQPEGSKYAKETNMQTAPQQEKEEIRPASKLAFLEDMRKALAREFDPNEVKLKAGVVRGNRALAFSYVDARVIEERLDDVFGVDCWQDSYEVLPNGSVVCSLSAFICGRYVCKSDVGSQSDQSDEGDRMKAAFSDALKRAAVKFGIGRYLYSLPQMWLDYDPKTKQLIRPEKPPASPPASPQAPSKPITPPAPPASPASPARPVQQGSFSAEEMGNWRNLLIESGSRGSMFMAKVWSEMPRGMRVILKKLKDEVKLKAELVDSVASTFPENEEMETAQ